MGKMLNFKPGLKSFWVWWSDEITAALPMAVQKLLFSKQQLILQVIDTALVVHKVMGSKHEEIYRGDVQEPMPSDLRGMIKELSAAEKIVKLSSQYVLEKSLSLPLATEENLRDALAYQMDRQTPFTSDQVYYDYIIKGRDKQKGMLQLKLVVAPKAKVDTILVHLSRQGFDPHVVTLDKPGEEQQINLLPAAQRANRFNIPRLINASLSLVLLALLATAVALPIWQKHRTLEQMQPQLSELMEKSKGIDELRRQIEQQKTDSAAMTQKKAQSRLYIELLTELTYLMPDDTWINQLEIRGGEIHLYGYATSSAALLQVIEDSKLFQNAQFRSPVTQNRLTNSERFHISAEISRNNPT